MQYDIFFSICQTPVDGYTPSEAEMFRNFFAQVEAADELGYGVGWVAESHLSSQVQKKTSEPVVPHWEGEVGLNVEGRAVAFLPTQIAPTGGGIQTDHTLLLSESTESGGGGII